VVFLAVLALVATVLLTRVELNGVALESHRFMSLLGFSAAFFALLLLPRIPPGSARSTCTGSIAAKARRKQGSLMLRCTLPAGEWLSLLAGKP
jgi:hypothetical protein